MRVHRAPVGAARLAAAALAAVTAACSSDSTGVSTNRKSVVLVAVNPASAQLAVGSTLPLAATAFDDGGGEVTGRQTFWASADSTVATVSGAGVVTGRRVGAVQIQAAVEGKPAYSFITVVPRPVGSVSVAPAPATVAAGATLQLQGTVKDDQGNTVTDRPVQWLSDNDAIARVTSTGLVSGVVPGTATITATAAEGKSGSVTVTVTGTIATPAEPGTGQTPPVVARVAVLPGPDGAGVFPDEVLPLTATAFDAGGSVLTGRAVAWSSSNDRVASVDAGGRVRGIAVGSATVSATIDGQRGSTVVTVSRKPARSVDITAPPKLVVGQRVQLTAVVRGADGKPLDGRTVTWTTSNAAVLAIESSTGSAEARGPGSAIITATVEGEGVASTTTTIVEAPANAPPTAAFVVGCTNLVCAFTDQSSDGDGAVTSWEWAFGDDRTSPHRHADNTFAARSAYTVTLRVTDDKGATATATKSVTPPASPTVLLVSRQTGKCLSTAGKSTSRDAALVIRPCGPASTDQRDQRYALPSGGGPGPLQLAGTADLRYVMEDLERSPILKLFSWNGGYAEWWTYTPDGQLRNFASNECITVGAPTDESPLDTKSCLSASDADIKSQQWDVRQ
jgi:uncharacterized protein YjdB